MKKKIIIIGPAYPYRGGIANFADLFVEQLMSEDEVNVITFKRLYPSFLFPGKTQFQDNINSAQIIAEKLIDSLNPFNWIKVANKIVTQKPDVVIFSYWLPLIAPCYGKIASILKKRSKAKMLCLCHNIIPHETHIGDTLLTKYLFKSIDNFIILSNNVVNDLMKLRPYAKFKILPHPVYYNFGMAIGKKEARRFLNLPDSEKLILFFGFIRDYKGLDILLEAMKELKDKEIKLIIAGEYYSNKTKYDKIINALELQNQLYLFTDYIPTSEVKYYFSACDAVILPYRDATQSGIVQIAMNFHKPVIATNVGGLAEVISDNSTGFIVKKDSPQDLAIAIGNFYRQNKEEQFISNIIKETDKYSWSKFTEGLFDLINS